MSIKTVTVTMPEDLYEELQKKLVDSGPCQNLSDAIYFVLRCFLDEHFDDSNVPQIPDGMSKYAFYLEKLRKGVKKTGGLFPGKSSEEVIEILRQTRKEIYEKRYAAHFGRK